jgi:hypothetical protein
MDEKKFNEILQFAIEKEIGTHNLYMMCKQVAKYSGAKELFAELAEGNSLVPIFSAGHRDISLNCYTAQLEPLPYLQG